MIAVGKLWITGELQVHRVWRQQFNGMYFWKSDPRNKMAYQIYGRNYNLPINTGKKIESKEGVIFDPSKHICFLESFVFLADSLEYFHVAARATLTASQINRRVFRDKRFWPRATLVRLDGPAKAGGDLSRPCSFIRRHNRVSSTIELLRAMETLHVG